MKKYINNYKVVLADHNRQCLRLISELLAEINKFSIEDYAFDGLQAYELTMKHTPDLLIIDLIMPIYDGFAVLEELRKNGYKKDTRIVMTSAVGVDYVFKKAQSYNVDHIFIKPFDKYVFKKRILELISHDNITTLDTDREKTPKDVVTRHIKTVGITANVKGYYYLRDAILMVFDDFDLISRLTTDLYVRIANKYNATPQRVERAMRHAIESAWNRGSIKVLEDFFGYTICDTKGKPTNGEFIAMLADKLNTELGCID
jgi:two-component system response regulator (stage 0 sporulation protein A)